jgi:hypothetical protein
MPSVQRPESQYGRQKPLVAKLCSKKNQGIDAKSNQASILTHGKPNRPNRI